MPALMSHAAPANSPPESVILIIRMRGRSQLTVAIVGGGPAGASAAETLLRGPGCTPKRVMVFEEKRGWEKPCGGGLTRKALDHWPSLAANGAPAHFVSELQINAPGAALCVPLHYLIESNQSYIGLGRRLCRALGQSLAGFVADAPRGSAGDGTHAASGR